MKIKLLYEKKEKDLSESGIMIVSMHRIEDEKENKDDTHPCESFHWETSI